jgi:hypothetical protein
MISISVNRIAMLICPVNGAAKKGATHNSGRSAYSLSREVL